MINERCLRAGENEDIKRMMWVVENLQEELLAADGARMAAEQQVQACSKIVQALQVIHPSPLCPLTAFPPQEVVFRMPDPFAVLSMNA